MIRVTAFRWVPPPAQGLVKDLRVRWALEELGLPYEARLIGLEDRESPAYRREQPFGQVPYYEETRDDGGTFGLFESGAILLHLAERSGKLAPADPEARAKAIQWMFAALSSMEPWVQMYGLIVGFYKDEEWAKLMRPWAQELAESRLDQLAAALGERAWLGDDFTVADLLMVTVLRILRNNAVIESRPTLKAYRERGEARPAFQRALAAQLAAFAENAPEAA